MRILAEERLRLETNGTAPPLPAEEPLRLIHELQVHQIELEMQNEELTRERDAWQKMEALLGKYSDLYDLAPVGYFNLDRAGVIRAVNLTGTGFLGVVRSLLINQPLAIFIADDSRTIFHDFLHRVFTSRVKETCELAFSKDRLPPLFVQVEAVVSESGEECRAAVIDITLRKRAEEANVRLAALVESSDDAIIAESLNGSIFSWNSGSERMFGYRTDEVMGKQIALLFPPERRDEEERILSRLSSGARIEPFETVRLAKDGRRVEVSVTVSAIRDGAGRIVGASKTVRDISERKRKDEALHDMNSNLERRVAERTEELAGTINNLRNEIVERGKAEEGLRRLNRLHAVLTETNQAIVRTKDRDALFKEFCTIAVRDGSFKLAWVGLVDHDSGALKIVAADGAAGFLEEIKVSAGEELARCGMTEISVHEGTYYICNDFLNSPVTRLWHERGRTHGIRASASIALKQEGRVIGALTLYAGKKDFFDRYQVDLLRQMGADISFALDNFQRETGRKEVERALYEQTVERLLVVEALREKEQMLIQQSRLAAMGEMIGNIAHQWRQPLNLLGLTAQQLLQYYDLGEFDRAFLVENLDKEMGLIQHMSRTIDDFINYFKPDKEKTDFKVQEVISKTLLLLKGGLRNPKITVETVVQGDPSVHGYPNEFAQVLLNLIVNAKDVLTERKIKGPRMTITTSSADGCAVVTVADNGGGVSEEIIDKIFDPYFTTKGPQQGTGIGLFMSKAIIEKNMAGRLTVSNTADGAEFRIEVCHGIGD